jgi:hypothetical protein
VKKSFTFDVVFRESVLLRLLALCQRDARFRKFFHSHYIKNKACCVVVIS